jgi:hypothetical protein
MAKDRQKTVYLGDMIIQPMYTPNKTGPAGHHSSGWCFLNGSHKAAEVTMEEAVRRVRNRVVPFLRQTTGGPTRIHDQKTRTLIEAALAAGGLDIDFDAQWKAADPSGLVAIVYEIWHTGKTDKTERAIFRWGNEFHEIYRICPYATT